MGDPRNSEISDLGKPSSFPGMTENLPTISPSQLKSYLFLQFSESEGDETKFVIQIK